MEPECISLEGSDCILTTRLDDTEPSLGLINVAELSGLGPVRVPAVVVVPEQPGRLVPGLAGVHLSPVETVQTVFSLIDVSSVKSPKLTITQLLNLAVLHGG